MNQWIKNALWLLGMLVMIFIVFRVESALNQAALQNFNLVEEVWLVSLISFMMGAYLSLLFISGKFSINVPLLVCVFLPTLILGFYLPVSMVTGLHIPIIPVWLTQFDRHGLIHLTSGLSLMMALFNGKK